MSEPVKRRGRPRKTEESPEQENTQAVSDDLVVEENAAQAKMRQYEEQKKAKEALEYTMVKYYYLEPFLDQKGRADKKIILVRQKNNGSCYRTYIGRASKEKASLEKITKEGLLKDKRG